MTMSSVALALLLDMRANNIRALRIERKLRQRDVADQVGVSEHELRKWERGLEHPPPRVMRAIATAFEVPVADLDRAQRAFAASVAPGEGYTTAQATYSAVEEPTVASPNGRLRVFDAFCGAGGLSFGLELTEYFSTIAALDLLPDRISTFRANHPSAIGFTGDIREFPAKLLGDSIGDIDIIVGGPPCQGFSSIRPFRTLTESDRRNTLIEEFLVLISSFRPRWFIFENVVGILTHKQGEYLQRILNAFRDSEYEVSWRVLNAALYGVPQNRERLFIIGNRLSVNFDWPTPSHYCDYNSMAGNRPEVINSTPLLSHNLPISVTLMDAIGDLPVLASGQSSDQYMSEPMNAYQLWARGTEKTLTLHRSTRHSSNMLTIIKHAGSNIHSLPPDMVQSGFSSCYSRLKADVPSTTLTVNFVHPASNRCIHPVQDRALTPREGARIQAFPDRYQFRGTRTQIVKQIGNAVPPLLAMKLGESIVAADPAFDT